MKLPAIANGINIMIPDRNAEPIALSPVQILSKAKNFIFAIFNNL